MSRSEALEAFVEELRCATIALKRYGVGWSPGVALSGGLVAKLVGDPILIGEVHDHGPLSFWIVRECDKPIWTGTSDSTSSFGEALLDATKWVLDHLEKRAAMAAETLTASC